MTRRGFGQYCGLARALELIGERWTLLIIRELLARPARYTDLVEDLPGIPTNLLSTRLKELEEAGIVERRIARAPQRGVVYILTPAGEGLEPSVLTLARWGHARLGEQRPGELVPPSSLALALRARFSPGAVPGLSASWEIRSAGVVLHAAVADGLIETGMGPAPFEPDLVIAIASEEVPTFGRIIQAAADGEVELTGRAELLEAFLRAFAPATPRTTAPAASDAR